jgi:hypothetical protein
MNKSFLALALALSVIPVAARADDAAPPQLTPAQRQAMQQTFERFATQEKQLHQQMRAQILTAMTPVQRRAVAATIGDLAIEPNPDPVAAAKRLDAILSPGERQRIIAAHSTFQSQSRQLHDQMRTELTSEMPADMQSRFANHQKDEHEMAPRQLDAGTLLLRVLVPRPQMMEMGDHGHFMMHMEGAPPPR